jgi:hypothetical protein
MEICKHENVSAAVSTGWGMKDTYISCNSCIKQLYYHHTCQHDSHDCPYETINDHEWYKTVYQQCKHSKDNITTSGYCGACGQYVKHIFESSVSKSPVKAQVFNAFNDQSSKSKKVTEQKKQLDKGKTKWK